MKDPYQNTYQDKALFKDVMDDLVNEDVLERYEMIPKKEGKKIVDWRFELYASNTFAKQVAANNKVANALLGNDPKPEEHSVSGIQEIKDEIDF
jgi:hypothetical protein